MAVLKSTIRNAPLTQLRTEISGGDMLLCKGTKPATLQLPSAGDLLSQHDLGANPGTVSNGLFSLADSDVAPDMAANNTGLPTWVCFTDSVGAAVAIFAVPSELSLNLNLPTGDTQIVAGREVDVDSLTIADGNT